MLEPSEKQGMGKWPCPWCGSEQVAMTIDQFQGWPTGAYAVCQRCAARGPWIAAAEPPATEARTVACCQGIVDTLRDQVVAEWYRPAQFIRLSISALEMWKDLTGKFVTLADERALMPLAEEKRDAALACLERVKVSR